MKRTLWVGLAIAGMARDAVAQSQVHLATQSTAADFANKTFTRPAKTGTVLPATCLVGEQFFKSDAAAGKNLYGCVAVNVWSMLAPAADLPVMAGQANKVLSTDGSNPQWRSLGGDVAGTPDASTVTRLQGRNMAATAPLDGQVLQWRGALSQWEPTLVSGAGNTAGAGIVITGSNIAADSSVLGFLSNPNTWTAAQTHQSALLVAGASAAFDATGANSTKPMKSGAVDPATCTSGEVFFNTTTNQHKGCGAANTWVLFGPTPAMTAVGRGIVWPFGTIPAAATSGLFPANESRFWQLTMPGRVTFAKLGIHLSAAGTASTGMQAGIYDDSCNVVARSQVLTGLNTTGARSIPWTAAQTIGPGTYFLALTTDDSAVTYTVSTTTPATVTALMNLEPADLRAFRGTASTGTGAAINLPGSCGARTSSPEPPPGVVLLP